FAGRNSAPTVTTANATITLDITGATLNTRTSRDGSTGSTAYSLTLTGTLTVALDGADPITEPVSGRFILTADPSTTSGAVQGELRVGGDADDSSTSAPGVRVGLSGTLDGSSLTIDHFVLVESANAPAGSVFPSPTPTSTLRSRRSRRAAATTGPRRSSTRPPGGRPVSPTRSSGQTRWSSTSGPATCLGPPRGRPGSARRRRPVRPRGGTSCRPAARPGRPSGARAPPSTPPRTGTSGCPPPGSAAARWTSTRWRCTSWGTPSGSA